MCMELYSCTSFRQVTAKVQLKTTSPTSFPQHAPFTVSRSEQMAPTSTSRVTPTTFQSFFKQTPYTIEPV